MRLARVLGASALIAAACAAGCAPVSVATFGSSNEGGALGGDAASGSSSGGAAGEGGVCAPGDVATYHPTYHLAAVKPGACSPTTGTPDLIGAFFEACLGSGKSDGMCQAFRHDNPDCASCILTPESAARYGPIIDHGGFVTANVAGCIQVEVAYQSPQGTGSGSGAVGCAQAVDALEGCELAACEANCPVADAASLADYQACASAAASGGCSTFSAAVTCIEPGAEAGVPSDCVQSDFGGFYRDVVPVFCLTAPSHDGGSPAPDAGVGGADSGTAAADSGSTAYDGGGGD